MGGCRRESRGNLRSVTSRARCGADRDFRLRSARQRYRPKCTAGDAQRTRFRTAVASHRTDRDRARGRVHLYDGEIERAAMMPLAAFSPARWWSIVRKEFLQLRRDRITFAMMIGVPIMQMILFGFAINSDPRHLPTAVIAADQSEFTRSFVAAMRNSEYFEIVALPGDEESARRALARGDVQFVLDIPAGFTRELVKGARPSLLVEADATDPVAIGAALGVLPAIAQSVLQRDLTGPL